jgi:hypothetical protein
MGATLNTLETADPPDDEEDDLTPTEWRKAAKFCGFKTVIQAAPQRENRNSRRVFVDGPQHNALKRLQNQAAAARTVNPQVPGSSPGRGANIFNYLRAARAFHTAVFRRILDALSNKKARVLRA